MAQRYPGVVLLSVVLAVILVSPAAFSDGGPQRAVGAPESAPGIVVSPEENPFELRTLEPTDAELAAAEPMDLLMAPGAPPGEAILEQPFPREPVTSPGSEPSPESLAELWAALVEDTSEELPQQAGSYYPYIPPYTAYPVNTSWQTWKYYPWSTMGKVYFRKRSDGRLYYCSAGVAGTRVAWTAGHCVADGGLRTWHYEMRFYPAIRTIGSKTIKPYGTWFIRRKATVDAWFAQGDFRYDIGIFSTYDHKDNALEYYTGYLGFSSDKSSVQHFNAFGYPKDLDDGGVLWTCQASTSRTDTSMSSPYPLGIGCIMGKGCSGGPRLIRFAPYTAGEANLVNGVNSYYYESKPREVFAAFFGAEAKELYEWGLAQ